VRYKIEKNTVQETLIIPLYARKMCSELYPNLYRDEAARRLVNAVDYDFSALEKKSRNLMQRFGFLEVAMRQNDLAYEVRDYLKTHPTAAVEPRLRAGLHRPRLRQRTLQNLQSGLSGCHRSAESAASRRRAGNEHPLRPERHSVV